MKPITRTEMYLAYITGEWETLPERQITRVEFYLSAIAGENTTLPNRPITRVEMYLARIAGQSVEIPDKPITRIEMYLAAIAGQGNEVPVPITRVEMYLATWAEQSSGTITTVTGLSPLALVNALAKPIKKLIQYGKVTTSGGDTYCNNGKLVAIDDELPSGYKRLTGISFDGNFHYETGEALTGYDEVTMTLDNLSSSGKNVFGSYNGANGKNFSLYIYGSSTSGSYFRFGDQLKRPKYGGTGRRTITFGAGGTSGFAEDVSIDPDEFTTPANTYIGMLPNSSSAAYIGDIVGSILVGTRLEWIPCESDGGVIGYYERVNGNFIAPTGDGTPVSLGYDTSHLVLGIVGTPEVLSVGTQTASVVNLFATGDVKDEQDIISGVVTRRTEVSVSGGVITVTALPTPITERVMAQPMRTAEGNNTVSVVSEVGNVNLSVEYMGAE